MTAPRSLCCPAEHRDATAGNSFHQKRPVAFPCMAKRGWFRLAKIRTDCHVHEIGMNQPKEPYIPRGIVFRPIARTMDEFPLFCPKSYRCHPKGHHTHADRPRLQRDPIPSAYTA